MPLRSGGGLVSPFFRSCDAGTVTCSFPVCRLALGPAETFVLAACARL